MVFCSEKAARDVQIGPQVHDPPRHCRAARVLEAGKGAEKTPGADCCTKTVFLELTELLAAARRVSPVGPCGSAPAHFWNRHRNFRTGGARRRALVPVPQAALQPQANSRNSGHSWRDLLGAGSRPRSAPGRGRGTTPLLPQLLLLQNHSRSSGMAARATFRHKDLEGASSGAARRPPLDLTYPRILWGSRGYNTHSVVLGTQRADSAVLARGDSDSETFPTSPTWGSWRRDVSPRWTGGPTPRSATLRTIPPTRRCSRCASDQTSAL